MRPNRLPILSVIMPVYNAEAYVSQAIESILNQTFADFELIIADDGSKDGSKEIIENYTKRDGRIRASHNCNNNGKTSTVNRLYKLSRGKYITIHDADDYSEPERFLAQIEFLEANTDHSVCGCFFNTVLDDGKMFSKNATKETHEEIMASLASGSQIHGPTSVFRDQEELKTTGIYRPYFKDNYEDVDLIYRLMDSGKGRNIARYLYNYRILETSLCRKDVSIKSRNLYKVVYHLKKQRLERGSDDLHEGKIEAVDNFFDRITSKYKKDGSLIHREAAEYYMYWGMHRLAVVEALKAVKNEPLRFVNYRTLQYCLRKAMFQ